MVPKSSNYKIQGTSNGHQVISLSLSLSLYIYIYIIIKCLINYSKITIKWNLIHEIITFEIFIIGCQILGLKKNGTYIMKL